MYTSHLRICGPQGGFRVLAGRQWIRQIMHIAAAAPLAVVLAILLTIIGPVAGAPAADTRYITENGAGRVVAVPTSGGTPHPWPLA